MQALKALVIFMGVLIAIGVTVIGVTIYRRATDMATSEKATPSASAPSTPGQTGAAAPQRIPPAVNPDTAAPGLANQGGGAPTLANAPASFGTRELALPPGSEIVSVQPMQVQDGEGRVVLHARLPDGGTRILVLDPRRGDIAGEWHVRGPQNSGAGSSTPGGAPRP